MNHLDEGTIHAWLDGALDATQSREIEAHVAGCPTCSAAVAEARGLVAGASRILGALDDVPGGVVPRGASPINAAAAPPMNAAAAPSMNAAAAPPRTAARLKPRGQWQTARWVSGIAAVFVGAVVLSTVHRVNPSMERASVAVDAGFDSALPIPAVREEAARGAESVVQPAAPPAAIPAPERARQMTSFAAGAGNSASKSTGAVTGAVSSDKSRDVASTRSEEVKGERAARERAVTPSFGEVPVARAQTVDTARMRTLGDQVAASQVVVTSAPAEAALSDSDAVRFAGCYRAEAAEISQQRAVAGGVAGGADRRRAAAAPRPAPSAALERAEASDRVTSIIRLDTARADGERRAVSLPTDSVIGLWRVVGDSIRVDLAGRGVVMLTPQRRVDCP